MEWYDNPLPEVHVTLWNIRELRLPNNATEHEELSFNPFPRTSQFAFFIETCNFAWAQLEPLLQMMIDTNDLQHTFGPAAFIMDVPVLNPSIERTQAHHTHGRISMGYNLATTMIERSEVRGGNEIFTKNKFSSKCYFDVRNL
jgi:hypothetical protein